MLGWLKSTHLDEISLTVEYEIVIKLKGLNLNTRK